jgi:hypothetical protein
MQAGRLRKGSLTVKSRPMRILQEESFQTAARTQNSGEGYDGEFGCSLDSTAAVHGLTVPPKVQVLNSLDEADRTNI